MERLQMFISSLQNRKEESDKLETITTQAYYYFWFGNKINQVHEHVQREFCQVIKIGKTTNNANSITLLKELFSSYFIKKESGNSHHLLYG